MTAQKLMLPTAKVNGERSLKDLCRRLEVNLETVFESEL